MNLLDLLGRERALQWFIMEVAGVRENPVGRPWVELKIRDIPVESSGMGGNDLVVTNASALASYTPRVGDIVHVLIHSKRGALVLGKVTTNIRANTPDDPKVDVLGVIPTDWRMSETPTDGMGDAVVGRSGEVVTINGMVRAAHDATYAQGAHHLLGVLPEGYRPKRRVVASGLVFDKSGHRPARIDISLDGEVFFLVWGSDSEMNVYSWVSLGGISWSVV
jgi:hypothetical protein